MLNELKDAVDQYQDQSNHTIVEENVDDEQNSQATMHVMDNSNSIAQTIHSGSNNQILFNNINNQYQ